MTTASNNTLCCHWCLADLSNASHITYLNGNLPVCGLCLIRAEGWRTIQKAARNDEPAYYCGPEDGVKK